MQYFHPLFEIVQLSFCLFKARIHLKPTLFWVVSLQKRVGGTEKRPS